jgi:hypothetical protein
MEREWRRQLHDQSERGISERIKLSNALNSYVKSKAGTPSHRAIKYRPIDWLTILVPTSIWMIQCQRFRTGP